MALLLGSVWLLLTFAVLSVSGCSTQEFTCSQGLVCVAEDRVCDFTDDCGDGSDEKNCLNYKRCDFEDGFCDLTQSSEALFKWTRTTEAGGLKHNHRNNTSAHFLSLSPVDGERTTADLYSPLFQPSQTCQLSFYHYVGTTHGGLQVLLQTHPGGQRTEVWRDSQQTLKETWLRTVIQFSNNNSFQVVIRGELSADSRASEVLAIDDLSFSPGCVTVPGNATINTISLHWQDNLRP